MNYRTLLAGLTLLATGTAFAQATDPAATPRVDKREARQEQRIEQGVASGQLTPRETHRLLAREARVENVEARAKSDGVVTAQERKHLAHLQNKDSAAIHRQKHDRQRDLNHDGKRDAQ